ncbi:MAG: hypothetical protein ABL996_07805 [Micropepsaceae bacterium]
MTGQLPRQNDPHSNMGPAAALARFALLVPSLSLMVFLRQGIGYRIVRYPIVAAAFIVMLMLAGVGALANVALSNLPTGAFGNLLGPAVASASARPEAPASVYNRRNPGIRAYPNELSPNAGQVSTPQTDPEAYRMPRDYPAGYRYQRNPDGSFTRGDGPNGFIVERIPAKPTIIPPDPNAPDAAPELPSSPAPFYLGGVRALFLWTFLFLPLAIHHHRQDWQRIVNGVPGSTFSRGRSHLAAVLPIRGDFVPRFVEPLICLALGLLMIRFLPILSVWLIIGGLTIATHEHMAREIYLNTFLDMLDAEYVGNWLNQDVQATKGGAAADSTAEYDGVIPSLPPALAQKMHDRQREWRERTAARAATSGAMAREDLPLTADEQQELDGILAEAEQDR